MWIAKVSPGMDAILSETHEKLVNEHFHEVDTKLKKLEHEAQAVEIPSNVSGKCLEFIL